MTAFSASGGGARRASLAPCDKPLLSVDEAAVLLGERREVIYASIRRGDFPLPVFTINGRLRIARRSVERLIDGRPSSFADDGPADQEPSGGTCRLSRSRATCSAARRSSSSTESV